MADASPVKWHLAHTTWFFESFILAHQSADYRVVDPRYNRLFTSYYEVKGERIARDRRGLISRPTVAEVLAYRSEIDARMDILLADEEARDRVADLVEVGLQHEQQHQELLLTDLKAALACNPLLPTYRRGAARALGGQVPALGWTRFEGGLVEVGHDGEGFAFDNEGPRHRVYLRPFEFASRPVTVGEYLEFLGDGGYRRPEFWLADGWAAVRAGHWESPLYWQGAGDGWGVFTLGGLRDLDASEPIAHVSYYEADAYATWAGARLPSEQEWEVAAVESGAEIAGNFADSGRLHPAPAGRIEATPLAQTYGDVWEWTSSPYVAYPGFRPAAGELREYNGKFMCNQLVLRGGSCATPSDHVRATYRNFFPAAKPLAVLGDSPRPRPGFDRDFDSAGSGPRGRRVVRGLKDLLDGPEQLIGRERLADVVADAQEFGVGAMPAPLVGGDHDRRDQAAVEGFELLQDQEPALARHHHVQDDQVGPFLLGGGQPGIAVAGNSDPEASVFE